MKPDEHLFEDAIEVYLLDHGGYLKSLPENFDAKLGLDLFELFSFIEATERKEWQNLLGRYGNNESEARKGFAKRLTKEIDSRGTVEGFSTWTKRSSRSIQASLVQTFSQR